MIVARRRAGQTSRSGRAVFSASATVRLDVCGVWALRSRHGLSRQCSSEEAAVAQPAIRTAARRAKRSGKAADSLRVHLCDTAILRKAVSRRLTAKQRQYLAGRFTFLGQ